MPIGGGEDRTDESDVHNRFVELAGGGDARIVVIPTASEHADQTAKDFIALFKKLGVADATDLKIDSRDDANSDESVALIEQATGVFISGGAQARLVAFLVGTRSMECLRMRNAEGVVVAGTSAGASVVASHMILGGTGIAGNSSDAAARRSMVEIVAGLGLLQDVIVDQHFSQRGRMGRLLTVFAGNPGLVAIGLDEDTAVVVNRDGILETLGSGMVTIIDGRQAISDYFDRKPGEVLTVSRSSLHVLGPGQRFGLDERRWIGPVA